MEGARRRATERIIIVGRTSVAISMDSSRWGRETRQNTLYLLWDVYGSGVGVGVDGGWWRFWWVGVFGACRADSLALAHKQAEALRGLADWQAGGLQR